MDDKDGSREPRFTKRFGNRRKPPEAPAETAAAAPAPAAPPAPSAPPPASLPGASVAGGFAPDVSRRVLDLPRTRHARMPGRPPSDSGRLIVGREISLSGNITACEMLVVEGSVEATLENSQTLEVAESGRFKGTVQIDEAVIAGQFEGALTVRDRLLVRPTGRITGKLLVARMEVELGGEIEGEIRILREAGEAGTADQG